MKMFLSLLKTEGKLAIHHLPKMLAGIFLFGALIFAVFTAANPSLNPLQIKIGMVLPEDPESRLTFSFVTSTVSSEDYLQFEEYSYEQGMDYLKKNQLAALLLVPENYVDEVMYGTVPELTVYLPGQIGMESLLFQEMADALIGIIYDTQVGSNAAHTFSEDHGLSYAQNDKGEEIAFSYLKFLFRRLSIFEESPLSDSLYNSGMVKLCSGLSLLLIFSGISCSGLFLWEKKGFSLYCRHKDISETILRFVKLLGMFTSLQVPFLLAVSAASMLDVLPVNNGLLFFLLWELSLLFVSVMTMSVYDMTKDLLSGVLLLFLGGFFFTFLTGSFLPQAFFPEIFLKLSPFLPVYGLTQTIAGALSGQVSSVGLISLILYGILFFFLPEWQKRFQRKEAVL